ncbi:MAG: hypothetical protein R3E12_16805, partial [Candidatus Eisenbacteria bacterium]
MPHEAARTDYPARKRPSRRSGVLTSALSVSSCLVLGELLVRFLAPQNVMFPRYRYSESYLTTLYPNSTVIHECPGRFRYRYTVNADGYRGERVDESSPRPKIVVLGDSYSLGVGVDDGDEYPAVLRREIDDTMDV